MYIEMKNDDLAFVTDMLGRINYSANKIFIQAYKNKGLINCLIFSDDNNKGVFTILQGSNYFSLQISFEKDVSNYKILKIIHEELNKILKIKGSKDIYLNINGYNPSIINYFRNYNFSQDSLGFEYCFSRLSENIDTISTFNIRDGLTIKSYEEKNAYKYLELLDEAFRDLNIECNEEQEQFSKNGDKFISWLRRVDEKKNFGALWNNLDLVGVYILNDDCIDTIAVNPNYEGKGYGTQLIKYCLKNMIIDKKYEEVYLRVYFQNIKAQKFYLKNSFNVRGYYSENTYISK